MTTTSEFRSRLEGLVNDSAVAGISLTGTYESLTGPTVTRRYDPAERQGGGPVHPG